VDTQYGNPFVPVAASGMMKARHGVGVLLADSICSGVTRLPGQTIGDRGGLTKVMPAGEN